MLEDIHAKNIWKTRDEIENYLNTTEGWVRVITILRDLPHLKESAFWDAIRTMQGDGWELRESHVTTIRRDRPPKRVEDLDWSDNTRLYPKVERNLFPYAAMVKETVI